ncbi:hypothetical protein K438DRAFT_1738273 [Mycena galopus ATCC 62051]|nr:hypothetical protein K438DRAFT_1738273 [Mycena galopus ATCC 62051]
MESPFTSRFNTNYVPSDEEIGSIRVDLLSHSQELARIDERIRELSAERDKIQRHIDSHEALISYPRRLPPDIVREIFVACLSSTVYAVMSVREAPLVLCQICSAWRTIALCTPRLWSSLHLPIDFILDKKEARRSAIARWLQLSGACPMSISVLGEAQGWRLPQAPADITAFSTLLAESSRRWCNVEFAHISEPAALGLAGLDTPMLESLKITATVSILRQLDLFRVPSLRTLALHSQGPEQLDEFILDMPLFWDQLTHLNFESTGPQSPSQGLSLHIVFVLLGRCPQLVSLAFRANTVHQAYSISGLLQLPFLESFIIFQPCVLEPASIAHLVEHLSMPELRRLHLPTGPSGTGTPTNFLITIGTRSPLLETILIYLYSFTKSSLLDGLKCVPSLLKLTALANPSYQTWQPHQTWQPGELIENLLTLLVPEESHTLCPQLQELRAQGCDSISRDVLMRFLQKRMQLTPGFRRLEISLTQPWGVPDVSEDDIQSFRSRGLDLSLIHDSPWSPEALETTQRDGLPTINWFESF